MDDNEGNISSGVSSGDFSLVEASSLLGSANTEFKMPDIPHQVLKTISEEKIAKLEFELEKSYLQCKVMGKSLVNLVKENENLKEKLKMTKNENEKYKEELSETLQQLGEAEFYISKQTNERKRESSFRHVYSLQNKNTSKSANPTHTFQNNTSHTSECRVSSAQMVPDIPDNSPPAAPDDENEADTPSVAISPQNRACQDLPSGSAPHQQPQQCFDTATGIINSRRAQYKNLFKTLSKLLCFPADISKLKDWVIETFSLDVISSDAIDVFFHLDREEVISHSNLHQLRQFFETIVRFDLVHTIDEFLEGNYDILQKYA